MKRKSGFVFEKSEQITKRHISLCDSAALRGIFEFSVSRRAAETRRFHEGWRYTKNEMWAKQQGNHARDLLFDWEYEFIVDQINLIKNAG